MKKKTIKVRVAYQGTTTAEGFQSIRPSFTLSHDDVMHYTLFSQAYGAFWRSWTTEETVRFTGSSNGAENKAHNAERHQGTRYEGQ